MSSTSDNKIEELEKRKKNYSQFLEERMPVLVDFAKSLELDKPHEILLNPENYIESISDYLQEQSILDEDRSWIITRIGYFVGEYYVKALNGYWGICEDINSNKFARYVIFFEGGFNDPFNVAAQYIDSPPPRQLLKAINL